MIAYINIDSEDGLIRLSFLLDEEGRYIMPSLSFVNSEKDYNKISTNLPIIDNPIYIFKNFKRYLITYLQHTVSKEDRKEFSDISDWITEESAKEILEMIKYAENLNCQVDFINGSGKPIFYRDRIQHQLIK